MAAIDISIIDALSFTKEARRGVLTDSFETSSDDAQTALDKVSSGELLTTHEENSLAVLFGYSPTTLRATSSCMGKTAGELVRPVAATAIVKAATRQLARPYVLKKQASKLEGRVRSYLEKRARIEGAIKATGAFMKNLEALLGKGAKVPWGSYSNAPKNVRAAWKNYTLAVKGGLDPAAARTAFNNVALAEAKAGTAAGEAALFKPPGAPLKTGPVPKPGAPPKLEPAPKSGTPPPPKEPVPAGTSPKGEGAPKTTEPAIGAKPAVSPPTPIEYGAIHDYVRGTKHKDLINMTPKEQLAQVGKVPGMRANMRDHIEQVLRRQGVEPTEAVRRAKAVTQIGIDAHIDFPVIRVDPTQGAISRMAKGDRFIAGVGEDAVKLEPRKSPIHGVWSTQKAPKVKTKSNKIPVSDAKMQQSTAKTPGGAVDEAVADIPGSWKNVGSDTSAYFKKHPWMLPAAGVGALGTAALVGDI